MADRPARAQRPTDALCDLEYEPDPPIFTPRITVIADLHSDREAWLGSARRSLGGRTATDVLTVAVRDLAPGDVVLMTTYRSDGRTVATGEPFLEARTTATDRAALLEELWDALAPELRVAVAAFEPGRLTEATIRHQASAATA